MVLFMILLSMLVVLTVITVLAVSATGAVGIILFSDIIVCIFLILWFIKKLLKGRK